jgi:hypothetical protein
LPSNDPPTPNRKVWLLPAAAGGLALLAIFWPRPEHAPAPASPTTTSGTSLVATTTTTLASPTTTVVLAPAVSLAQPAPETTKAADLDAARTVVAAFVPAWLAPGSPDERRAALAPVASPGLVDLLAEVPAENLPAASLASVGAPAFDGYTATVPATLTDGSAVLVDVVETAAGWRVSDVRQAAS